MNKKQLIKLLLISAKELYRTTLNATPSCYKKFEYLTTSIKVGDIVFENSSLDWKLNDKDDAYLDNIGYLKEIIKDKNDFSVYVIKRLYDNKIVKWENCSFIKVPEELLYNILKED